MKFEDRFLYHIYALGALGVLDAPRSPAPEAPIRRVADWIPTLHRLGADTLLLGPVSDSASHGYDVLDLDRVDPRLGTAGDLTWLSRELSRNGIGLMLDAVLNHVGHGHPLVQEVSRNPASPRAAWIAGHNPHQSRGGLPFGYCAWQGHDELVQLNTAHPEVREWLIGAVLRWMDRFGICGIRLDAADCLDDGFLKELVRRCRDRDPNFGFIGEALPAETGARLLGGGLDAVTGYESYKSLWSSFNDRNFFELSWTLNRLFGSKGLCRGGLTQNFADNHDVDRIASVLHDHAHLYPLYGLLFALPGIPSVYYGSEFGISGKRTRQGDRELRPALNPAQLPAAASQPDLPAAIARFATARRRSPALRHGDCCVLLTQPEQISFRRRTSEETVLVIVNAAHHPVHVTVPSAGISRQKLTDLLSPDFTVRLNEKGDAELDIPPTWLRLLSDIP